MDGETMHPDTTARVFEIIHGYAGGETEITSQVIALIPHEELAHAAAFALGMLGGLYRLDPRAKELIDLTEQRLRPEQ